MINLAVSKAHAAVDLAALSAGNVYSESRSRSREGVRSRLATPRAFVGSAPDTFLGAGIQTCLKAVADGLIGEPVAATAFVTGHGHESWHPDPEFYYQAGGGPLFDMGPYYLTALVAFLGRARRVSASTKATFAERTITSQPKNGQRSKSKSPRTTQASSISTAEPLPRCLRASTCGAPSSRASRSTGLKARSACLSQRIRRRADGLSRG